MFDKVLVTLLLYPPAITEQGPSELIVLQSPPPTVDKHPVALF